MKGHSSDKKLGMIDDSLFIFDVNWVTSAILFLRFLFKVNVQKFPVKKLTVLKNSTKTLKIQILKIR